MNIGTSCARFLSAVMLVLAATTTAACGVWEDEDPALCTSLDSLESSFASLNDIEIDQGALSELESSFEQIQSDLRQVEDDAGDEFKDEIDAVDRATSGLRESLDKAVATPSLQTVSDVGTSIQNLGTSLRSLADAVQGTC